VSVSTTEATVSVLPGPSEPASPLQGSPPNPFTVSEFKIRPEAAERVEGALRRRVLGHRTTAAILMLAALAAIGGGIALIFYAGELAKQQRAADVDSLVERAGVLSKRADTIRADAEDKIGHLRDDPRTDIENITRDISDTQSKLSAEKDPSKIKDIQSVI